MQKAPIGVMGITKAGLIIPPKNNPNENNTVPAINRYEAICFKINGNDIDPIIKPKTILIKTNSLAWW